MIIQDQVYKFSNLSNFDNLCHFVSTRNGGVSQHPFESLNLSYRSLDKNENVSANRRLLFDTLRIPLKYVTLGQQTHSGNVHIVSPEEKGRGSFDYESAIPDSDSLVTSHKNICLMVLLADCVPVFFFDPENNVISVAHAGRAGTEKCISINTAMVLKNTFNSNLRNLIVGIGPAIGINYYNIADDSALKLKRILPSNTKSIRIAESKAYIDLALANKEQLLEIGLQEKNIELSNLCTFSLPKIFFSERRDGKPTGRFGAGIMLTNR
jgi:YfiH family protein